MPLFNVVLQPLLLLGGAFIGALLIFSLPFAWLIAGIVLLPRMALNALTSSARRNASFGWRPLESYFTGKKNKRSRK